MKKMSVILLVLIAPLPIGCTGLKSVPFEQNSTGRPYFLPTGIVTLKINKTGEKDLSIKNAEVSVRPDDKFGYTLQYHPDPMSNDDLSYKTTNTGLLKEIKFTSDEQTDDFIIKLAELGKETSKLLMPIPRGIVKEADSISYDAMFDPFDKNDFDRVQKDIKEIDSNYEIEFPALNKVHADKEQCKKDNICFRTMSQYPLILKKNQKELQRVYLELPDVSIMGNIDISRSAFVKRETTYIFDNGVLTDVSIKKPSEAVAAIEIPITVVKSITSIPSEMIAKSLGNSTANKNLYTAQREELEAKRLLIEKQLDILNKNKNPVGGDPLQDDK